MVCQKFLRLIKKKILSCVTYLSNTDKFMHVTTKFLIHLIPKWQSLVMVGVSSAETRHRGQPCIIIHMAIVCDHASQLLCTYCTKKVYVENGVKISYHKFSKDQSVFNQWIAVIQRDIGTILKCQKTREFAHAILSLRIISSRLQENFKDYCCTIRISLEEGFANKKKSTKA